jgi:SprB repeat/Secretion system C-terminal sorting domain
MKKILFAAIVLFWVNHLFAQSWISSSQISASSDLLEHASVIDDNGNIFTFGSFEGTMSLPDGNTITSYGGRDYYLIKYLPDGSVDWVANYGGTSNEFGAGGLNVDANGNAYITGAFQGVMNYSGTGTLTSTGTLDAFLIKVQSNGDVEWAKNIGQGFFLQYTTSLEIDKTGDVLVAGSFRDSIVFNEFLTLYSIPLKFDAFYAKFNPINGDLIWAKHLKSLNGNQVSVLDIEAEANSYFFVGMYTDTLAYESGTITSEYSERNTYLIKTDLSGNIDWLRRIEGSKTVYGYSLVLDDENNVYLSSFYDSASIFIETAEDIFLEVDENEGSNDIYCVKYNTSGDMEWYRSMGGKGNERVYSIEFFEDKVWTAGYISDTVQWGGTELAPSATSGQDMYTGAFTKDGDPRDANITRGEGLDESRAIFQNGDQLYTVMRSTSDNLRIGEETYDSNGGSYYIVLGVIGCLPITVNDPTTIDIAGCYGDSTGMIQIVSSGGFGAPWAYSIDNGATYSDQQFFNDLPAGDYQIVVIDKEGCAQTGPLTTLTQPDTLILTVTDVTDILCTGDNNGALTINVTGGTAPYSYSSDSGQVFSSNIAIFSDLPAGIYQAAVADSKLCTSIAPKDTIFEPDALPEVTDVVSSDILCFGESSGTITISAQGGTAPLTFSVDNGVVFADNPLITDLPAGDYQIVVQDANNCVTVGPATAIVQPDALEITGVDPSDILCFGESTGTITISALGGTAPLTFSVDNGVVYADNPLFTDLPPGDYQIVVQDANNCVTTGPVTALAQPDRLEVTGVDHSDVTCFGESSGTITISALGGTAPLTFSVDGEVYADNPLIAGLPAGDYQIVVQDANDCVAEGPTTSLVQPDTLEAILVSSEDIVRHITWKEEVEITEGSLTVAASGGTSPYTFQLLPAGSPQALGTFYFPLEDSGKYVVAVDDLNGCGPAVTDTVEIHVVYTDATGIGDFNGSEVKLYPNPTSGIITIEMPFEGTECEMEVLSMTGQVVLKRRVFSNGGILNESIDLSEQAKGLYMLRVDGVSLRSAIMVK